MFSCDDVRFTLQTYSLNRHELNSTSGNSSRIDQQSLQSVYNRNIQLHFKASPLLGDDKGDDSAPKNKLTNGLSPRFGVGIAGEGTPVSDHQEKKRTIIQVSAESADDDAADDLFPKADGTLPKKRLRRHASAESAAASRKSDPASGKENSRLDPSPTGSDPVSPWGALGEEESQAPW